jgi:hypothetical protein
MLRSAPYVGWVFDVLVTAAGLGAGWMAYRDSRRKPDALPAGKEAGKAGSAPDVSKSKPKKVPVKAK